MDYKMKDCGVEWIGEIPMEWSIERLKYRTNKIGSGATPLGGAEIYETEGILFLRSQNIYNGGLKIEDAFYITDRIHKEMNRTHVKKNDVLLNITGGSIGRSTIYNLSDEANVNQHVSIIRCSQNLWPKFLYYFLISPTGQEQIFNNQQGGNRESLTFEMIGNFILAMPGYLEQTKIANFLDRETDRFDLIIEKSNASIKKLQAYRKSVIYEAVTKGLDKKVQMKDSGVEWIGEIPVGWEISKIKYLSEYFNGLTYNPDDMTEDSGTIVLRANNIQNGKLTFNEEVYIDMKISNKLKLRKDDILICSRNGSRRLIGKNALVTDDFTGLTFGAFNMVCRSDMSAYLYYVLNSDVFNSQLSGVLTSTINQLTGQNFGSMVVPNPPLSHQKAIADYLDTKTSEIDAAINKLNQLIDTTEKIKKSIIYEYVTGKKRVPDFNTGGV